MHPSLSSAASCALAAGLALAGAVSFAADRYEPSPESQERGPGVPEGRIETFEFTASQVFPNTTRQGWVYVPAQYDASRPAALMVFQDGHSYLNPAGRFRAPVVLDNLIARGEMPVTVAIFINPGHRGDGAPPADRWGNRNNRSVEYDSLGDAYARFLVDELIPHVAGRWNLNLSTNPALRAVAGQSSGGICAWTAAWERPDQFGKVLSQIGSFVNIRGGHVYPALLRKSERRPVRVFLQDGSNDLNNEHGNWPLANLQMADSLAFTGYDFRFEFGDGAHNDVHSGALLPESLRWLWKPELPPAAAPASPLDPDARWELVGEGYAFTDAACGAPDGTFYFADLPRGTIFRVPPAGGRPEPWLENGPKISGLKFGPDGRLYACVQGTGTNDVKTIAAIDPQTKAIEVIATGVRPNDLAVSRAGFIYFTQTDEGQVVRVPITARSMPRPPVAAGGIRRPNGIALSPDETQLFVSEYGGTHVWRYTLAPDGAIRAGERIAVLEVPAGRPDSGGDGSATDAAGRVYVTSHLGLQVLDPQGRRLGILPRPQDKGTVSCDWAGEARGYLYACSSDRVYRIRPLARGR